MVSNDDSSIQSCELSPEVAKMLFELHHRQLDETQKQIQSITEKTIAVIFLITGWVVLASTTPSTVSKTVFSTGIVILGLTAITFLLTHAVGRRRVASVVEKLNYHYHLFDGWCGKESEPLYPEAWKGFGSRTLWWFVGAHIAAVAIATGVALVAVYIK